MKTRVVALALFLGGVQVVHAEGAEPAYPSMAPLELYRPESQEDEDSRFALAAEPPAVRPLNKGGSPWP
jgi:hypothetical protein